MERDLAQTKAAAAVLVAVLAGLGPRLVRDTRTAAPAITDDQNLNLVLFGSSDIDDTGDAP